MNQFNIDQLYDLAKRWEDSAKAISSGSPMIAPIKALQNSSHWNPAQVINILTEELRSLTSELSLCMEED